MPIKNTKQKGSRIELKFKKYLQSFGYYVTKAGGSFGIDLIAVKKDVPVLFINVKALRKYCGPAERKELVDLSKEYGVLPILAYVTKTSPEKRGKYVLEYIYSSETTRPALTAMVALERLGKRMEEDSSYAAVLSSVLESPILPPCNPPEQQ